MNYDEIKQNIINDRNETQKRINELNTQKQNNINQITNTYNNMINNSQSYYDQQAQATKEYADKQSELQQANTDFAIEKINQQKEQQQKDYIKEQKGAYQDYMKANDEYGVNAEQMAAQGLTGSGYEASVDYKYYNTYQNRVATARDTYNKAILNYDNSIKDAQLQNNSKLAEIAFNALQTQLQLSIEGMQYKNTLLQNKINAINDAENLYNTQYSTYASNLNSQNSLLVDLNKIDEERRQFQEELAEKRRQFNIQMAEEQRQFNSKLANSSKSSTSNSVGAELTNGSGSSAYSKTKKQGVLTSSNGKVTVVDLYKKGDTYYYIDKNTGKYKKYKN